MADELRPLVDKAAEAFAGALRALGGWASFMGDAQVRTRRLELDAQDALAELAHAQAALGHAPTPPVTLTPVAWEPAQQRLADEQAMDYSALTRTVSAAQDRLDHVRRSAQRHGEEYETRGAEVARALAVAIQAAPNTPSSWFGLRDRIGNAFESAGNFLSDLPGGAMDMLKAAAPVLQVVGDTASILGGVCAVAALVPGGQFLAPIAVGLSAAAFLTHYLAAAASTGSLTKPLTTKDLAVGIGMDAVALIGGAGALKAGKATLGAVRGAGARTRTVRQWIGPEKELPLGYFQLARETYPMSQAEFGTRLVAYHYSAVGNTATAAGLPGAFTNLHNRIEGGTRAPGSTQ